MYNFSTQHMSGTQKHVVDKRINDEKERQKKFEKKRQVENLMVEIKKEIEQHENETIEVVLSKTIFNQLKEYNQDITNAAEFTSIFGKPIVVDEKEKKFSINIVY